MSLDHPANGVEQKHIKKIPVMEIFGPTIQGEGALIGTQTMFVRLGLCDYKCVKCDSVHAIDPHYVSANATWLTQEDLTKKILSIPGMLKTRHITWSGGNPVIHDLSEVAETLLNHNFYLACETQGTIFRPWLRLIHDVTISPKSPGMGERFEPHVFKNFLDKCCEVGARERINIKVVAFSQTDLEFAAMIREEFAIHYNIPMFISLGNPDIPTLTDESRTLQDPTLHNSPLTKSALRLKLLDEYAILAEEITSDPRLQGIKFLPQLHVLAWGNERGR